MSLVPISRHFVRNIDFVKKYSLHALTYKPFKKVDPFGPTLTSIRVKI